MGSEDTDRNGQKLDNIVRDNEDYYSRVVETVMNRGSDGAFFLGNDGILKYVSPPLVNMFGYESQEEWIGESFRKFVVFSEQEEKLHKKIIKKDGKTLTWETEGIKVDGSILYIEVNSTVELGEDGKPIGISGMVRDVTEKAKLKKEKEHLLHYDSVIPSIYNRPTFLANLEQSIHNGSRYGIPGWFFFVDIDDFKIVNKKLGHVKADEVLKQSGSRINIIMRVEDLVGRYGGDELCVYAIDKDVNHADVIAKRILDRICKPYEIGGQKFDFISASIGYAGFPDDATKALDLINCADVAMYRAKELGKSQVIKFDNSML